MITIRQVERDEHYALHIIKKFIRKQHPILISITFTLIIMFILASLGMIMMFAAVGGGYVETNLKAQLSNGEISLEYYTITMKIMDVIVVMYNFIGVLMDFVVAGLILFWSYFGFKMYLRYKGDNL